MAHSNAIRDSVLQAIGNTPVVRLRRVVTPSMADVLVKLEYYNPTGSYKDRMALAMIEGAEARGELRPGMRVVEWTAEARDRLLRWSARSRATTSRPFPRTDLRKKNCRPCVFSARTWRFFRPKAASLYRSFTRE
jgi:hypothetical protein